jgi:DNA-binding transcriptional regulator LsrR (DeoR family)
VAIFSPLFAASEAAARSLRDDPAIQRALALNDDLDLAVLSLASWDPPITQLASFATPGDRAELAEAEARAELAGIFVKDDGGLVEASLSRRRISISPDQLRRIPRVLAVAGSVEKAEAIAAVARSGLITSLITDDKTAMALLRMPAVSGHRLDRESAAAHSTSRS